MVCVCEGDVCGWCVSGSVRRSLSLFECVCVLSDYTSSYVCPGDVHPDARRRCVRRSGRGLRDVPPV